MLIDRDAEVYRVNVASTYWMPGVNHLATDGRWVFVGFGGVCEFEPDSQTRVWTGFQEMITSVAL